MPDIIVCEDNQEIGNLLCDFLKKENYTVALANTGERAVELFEKYGAKLIVLDVMLPGIDGFSVCSKIRESSNTHIIIASARGDKESKLEGLMTGADDYIEKPYDVDILLAKIKGIFKRKYAIEEVTDGNLVLNTVQRSLTVNGKPVDELPYAIWTHLPGIDLNPDLLAEKTKCSRHYLNKIIVFSSF